MMKIRASCTLNFDFEFDVDTQKEASKLIQSVLSPIFERIMNSDNSLEGKVRLLDVSPTLVQVDIPDSKEGRAFVEGVEDYVEKVDISPKKQQLSDLGEIFGFLRKPGDNEWEASKPQG